jgi:hypothetical protein
MRRVSKWGRAVGKGGAKRRFSPGTVATHLAVWGLVLFVVAAVAVPLFINNRYAAWDGAAKGRLLRAVDAMEECAQVRRGSYAGCDAFTMKGIERGVRWRDPNAGDGYFAERKRDKVGLVFVSERGEDSFRVETMSRTGRLFAYDYQAGEVARTRTGNAEGPVPW